MQRGTQRGFITVVTVVDGANLMRFAFHINIYLDNHSTRISLPLRSFAKDFDTSYD